MLWGRFGVDWGLVGKRLRVLRRTLGIVMDRGGMTFGVEVVGLAVGEIPGLFYVFNFKRRSFSACHLQIGDSSR